MSKLLALVASLALLSTACTGGGEPSVENVYNTFEAPPSVVQIVGDDDSWRTNPPSESYAMREIHIDMAEVLVPMFMDMVQPLFGNGDFEKHCSINPYRWAPEDMTIPFGAGTTANWCGGIYFENVRYTPESDIKYGQPVPDEGPFANVPDNARRVDNRSEPNPDLVSFEESHEVSQSVSHSQSSTFTLDVTVGTDTSIGGEYAGASFEQSISTEVHTGLEKSKESTEEKSETQTDTVSIEFEPPANSDTLFTFTNAPVTIRTDYALDAYYDFGITIYFNNMNKTGYENSRAGYNNQVAQDTWNLWSRYNFFNRCFATDDNPGWRDRVRSGKRDNEYTEFKFESISDLADMVNGTNVKWPRFGDADCSLHTGEQDNAVGYHGIWPGVGREMDRANDPDIVHIQLTGTRVQTTASALTVKTYDLSKCPEDVADKMEDNAENEDVETIADIFSHGFSEPQTCQNEQSGVNASTTRVPSKHQPSPPPTTTTEGN